MSQGIEIYYGNDWTETRSSVSNYTVAENYTLIAYSGGTASNTTVGSGGIMKVSGGTATKTTVKSNGFMLVESGSVSGITVRADGSLQLTGTASDIAVMSGGEARVNSGGIADDLTLYVNGTVTVNQGGVIRNSIQRNGSILLSGGSAEDVTVYSGTLTVGNGSAASRISLELDGASLTVSSGGTLQDSICDGAGIIAESGSVICNTTVTGYEKEDPFEELEAQIFRGKMTLRSGAVHQGTLAITARGEVIAESGSVIDFTVAETTPGAPALIDNFAGITGSPDYTLTVKPDQQTGIYALAAKVNSFGYTVSVQNTDGAALGSVSTAKALVTPDYSCTLTLAGQTLNLTIADSPEKPHDLSGNANGVSWQSSADDFTVQYTLDDFASVLEFQSDACGADTYALPAGTYDWQVKNAAGSRWSEGDAFASSYTPGEAAAWQSDDDGVIDLFFADASGTWTANYAAQHAGSLEDWSGTNERVSLAGKNRFADTFAGSDDANILVLTDDANGDALFVDDIYTAFPANPQSRIAQIDEIRAGAGDDIVDMTSRQFEYIGDGLTIRGGDGNDTIWANKGNNMLFGDAGNDRLAGASGNDVLAGGTGNDSMHGGGGNDIFCFCDNWGTDTLEQLSDGSVTLWFVSGSEENWDQATMTYTDGANTVKVSGVTSITLKFGDDGSARYDTLAVAGCFSSETSAKIFETEPKSVLAVV